MNRTNIDVLFHLLLIVIIPMIDNTMALCCIASVVLLLFGMKGLSLIKLMVESVGIMVLFGGFFVLIFAFQNGMAMGALKGGQLLLAIVVGRGLVQYYSLTQLKQSLLWLKVPEVLVDIMMTIMTYYRILLKEGRTLVGIYRVRTLQLSGTANILDRLRVVGGMIGSFYMKSESRAEKVIMARKIRGEL